MVLPAGTRGCCLGWGVPSSHTPGFLLGGGEATPPRQSRRAEGQGCLLTGSYLRAGQGWGTPGQRQLRRGRAVDEACRWAGPVKAPLWGHLRPPAPRPRREQSPVPLHRRRRRGVHHRAPRARPARGPCHALPRSRSSNQSQSQPPLLPTSQNHRITE